MDHSEQNVILKAAGEMQNDKVSNSCGMVLAVVRKVFSGAAFAILPGIAANAEQLEVQHRQMLMHQFMDVRAENGKILGRAEFTQVVQGDEVTMRLRYQFLDGSIDDETTTYRQQGTFQLVRDQHVQKGPFFTSPVDFTVDGTTGTATTITTDKKGRVHTASEHMDLPKDLSNGFVGTLLVNVPRNTKPFRVSLLVPVNGGRLIHIQISPEGERPFQMEGQPLKATVFRIHPDLGRIVGLFARMLGLQPKDVMVWVLEGEQPEVMRIFGQLGGSGPVVSSELEGTKF